MGLSFCSLASGSSGNCYIIKSSSSAILIDAGISTKKIHSLIDKLDVKRSDIHGVFVTHEHSDHIKALPVLTKQNPEWNVYASFGTCRQLCDKVHSECQLKSFNTGSCIAVGDMTVSSFGSSHDASDPVCYSVECEGKKIVVLTDTGLVPAGIAEEMTSADIIVLESNYEVNMLKMGPYPYNLKRRILGDKGHLSNEDAGDILTSVMSKDSRFRHVFLAHLSKENNFPKLAHQTVLNILEENGFYADRDLQLEVLSRDGLSGFTDI